MTSYSPEQIEAVQNAVDRVGANWDAATEQTVEDHLRGALTSVGVELADDEVDRLAAAIDRNDGIVDAAAVLAAG